MEGNIVQDSQGTDVDHGERTNIVAGQHIHSSMAENSCKSFGLHLEMSITTGQENHLETSINTGRDKSVCVTFKHGRNPWTPR